MAVHSPVNGENGPGEGSDPEHGGEEAEFGGAVLHGRIVPGARGVCVGLVVDFRGVLRDARAEEVDPAERAQPARRTIPVENAVCPIVGDAHGFGFRGEPVGADEGQVPRSHAGDDFAVALPVLEDDPAGVEGRTDGGGAGGDDEGGFGEGGDHGAHASIVTKSRGVCVA